MTTDLDRLIEAKLLPTVWTMRTQDHGRLNPHVLRIEDGVGKVLWERVME